MRIRIHIWLALAAMLVIANPQDGLASDAQEFPRLGPHTFVPNSFVREPFIQSYIRTGTGGGATNSVEVPAVILPDSTVLTNLSTSVTVVALEFEVQQALKSWVGVRANFEILGRLGTSAEALLSEGITGVGGFELGWLFKLLSRERDALSLDVYMQRSNGSFINLLDWLDRIIKDGGLEPDNTLVSSGESLRGMSSLNYAHGFSPLLGLTAEALLSYGERLDQASESEFGFMLATGLSINLHDTTSIPFGVYLGYGMSDLNDVERDMEGPAQLANVRIDYMGFEDFVVGMDLGFSSFSVTGIDQRIQATTFLFTMRYFY